MLLALRARESAPYEHAHVFTDRDPDQSFREIVRDIELGHASSVAFVLPPGPVWPVPLYELALMTAGRAYDMGIELATTIVTPEDSPLAIFGSTASSAVAELLERGHIQTINSAYAEIPHCGEVVINPGDRRLQVDRVIALPELYGPRVRGIPLGENGFIRVNPYGQVPDAGPIYAAGDAVEFAVKHGGIASQQADVAAQSIAALAGAPVTPQPFNPVIHGMLITDGEPLYLTARITGGHGFSSEITDTPTWSPPTKIAATYLAPYLAALDRETTPA